MCGIFFTVGEYDYSKFTSIAHRGPDSYKIIKEDNKVFGFHRLKINDLNGGEQPFLIEDVICMCNGEIYNFKELIESHKLNVNSGSDCEVIPHLYIKYGFKKTIEMLDGVFACVLYDKKTKITYAARDPVGVRSMFIDLDTTTIASEFKACGGVQFPPGFIWNSVNGYARYFNIEQNKFIKDVDFIKKELKDRLFKAVKKRLTSDRPIGCLLSGGVDSSIIAAILAELVKPVRIKTFSVGLEGSPDLEYAKIVSNYINSEHHELILDEDEMLFGIDETIFKLETYDTTTIRAGTPMYLLAKWIKKNFDTTVIFSGEGSDELSGSYMYFHNAPSANAFHQECLRLINDLSYFDVLRCDKSIAGAGLEVRVPFLDKEFLQFYMSVDPSLKMVNNQRNIEKFLLRSSFDKLVPDIILWRKKEGMSDGVSSTDKSWYSIIQEYADKKYNNDEYKLLASQYEFNKPLFKESLMYREIFSKYYPLGCKTIPYYWLPKWSGDIIEPSARVLDVYS